jgi:hypothetical protein
LPDLRPQVQPPKKLVDGYWNLWIDGYWNLEILESWSPGILESWKLGIYMMMQWIVRLVL